MQKINVKKIYYETLNATVDVIPKDFKILNVIRIDEFFLQYRVNAVADGKEGKLYLAISAVVFALMFSAFYVNYNLAIFLVVIFMIFFTRGIGFWYFGKRAKKMLDGKVGNAAVLTNSFIYMQPFFPWKGDLRAIPISEIDDLISKKSSVGYDLTMIMGEKEIPLTSFVSETSSFEWVKQFRVLKRPPRE